MSTPAAYFISDAHLGVPDADQRSREERLCGLLERIGPEASDLFVVGDLFDFWIEYPRLIRCDYFRTLCALAGLRRRGVQVHYIAGNHDFALGPFLGRELGVRIYPRACECTLQGRRLHVRHGDGLLRVDIGYRLLRPVLRNRVNQWLYRTLLPGWLGIWLAGRASAVSRRFSRGGLSEHFLNDYRTAARKTLQTGFDVVVYGHTHYPELYTGECGTYCNCGQWLREHNYAMLRDGELTLWRLADDGSAQQLQPRTWNAARSAS